MTIERNARMERRPRREPAWKLHVDPALSELPFSVIALEWAAEKGAYTLRQLARIPPEQVQAAHGKSNGVLPMMRGFVERLLGRSWEELASLSVLPEPAPRRPTCWDELRLVLPDPLRLTLLGHLPLPPPMKNYVTRERLTTLGELARRSEAEISTGQRVGRISVHRTFLAVMALATGAP